MLPLGEMTNFVQQHSERVSVLAGKLYDALISGDQGAYVAKTGSLLRSRTLRSKETRKAFAVIVEAAVGSPVQNEENDRKEKRFWSKRVVLDLEQTGRAGRFKTDGQRSSVASAATSWVSVARVVQGTKWVDP